VRHQRPASTLHSFGGEMVSTGWKKRLAAVPGWSVGQVKSRPSLNCENASQSCCLSSLAAKAARLTQGSPVALGWGVTNSRLVHVRFSVEERGREPTTGMRSSAGLLAQGSARRNERAMTVDADVKPVRDRSSILLASTRSLQKRRDTAGSTLLFAAIARNSEERGLSCSTTTVESFWRRT